MPTVSELYGATATTNSQYIKRARPGRFGTSSGMLHTEILVIDQARLFISSFDIDGRSERYEGSSCPLDATGEGIEVGVGQLR